VLRGWRCWHDAAAVGAYPAGSGVVRVGKAALAMTKRGWFDRNKHLYPDNWSEIAKHIKDSAGWCCSACDAPHGPSPHILTVHHLDHNPANCEYDNLLALCQRCHLRLGPGIFSKTEAIVRLQRRASFDRAQMELGL
jgi:hypothetical protein